MRNVFLFLSLAAAAASGVAACGGSSDAPSPAPSDAGSDATPAVDGAADDAGPLPDGRATLDASDGGDATASEADDAAVDAPDATALDDGGDAGPLARQAVLVAAGNTVVGVTSDDYVVYATPVPDAGTGAGHALMVIGADGGTPQQLSTTQSTVVVAGATVVWADAPAAGGDACLAQFAPVSLKSWSSSRGATVIAPLALRGGSLGITNLVVSAGNRAVVSADGSEVAYATGCTIDDGGLSQLTGLALAKTDGTGSAQTFTFPSPAPLDAILSVNGVAITARENLAAGAGYTSSLIAGAPLALVIPNLVDPIRDPTGAWAWEPASTGMQLVLTSSGLVVFTDPDALGDGDFDGAGASLFYSATAGIKQLALASPTSATTLPGTAGVQPITLAPNGSAVGYQVVAQDGGTTYGVVTTGGAPTSFATAARPQFLPDSTLYWYTSTTTLSTEPALGGPVSTVSTPGVYSGSIGGSQILVSAPNETVFVVDAHGNIPTFALAPETTSSAVKSPPQGGLVAYSANGGIYVVSTN